jgi:hypothetical protein
MRKVKVMLMVIAVMAVVGGALAFRATTYLGQFCTRRVADGPGTCQGYYIGRERVDMFAKPYYTTNTGNPVLCTGKANCPISTLLLNVEP